jgi:hypothetical protein
MRKYLLMVSLAACCALVLGTSVALAGDNWVGNWKLNAAKSTFSPGPAPKSQTLKFETTKDGIQLTTDGVTGDGQTVHGGYVSRFDGKDVPWAGNPDADMASPRKIDDNTYENTWKKSGKATMSTKVVVSKDGKVLTVSQTGTNAKGQAVKNVVVYDKQ